MKIADFVRRKPPFHLPRRLKPADAPACAKLHMSGFAHSWSVNEFEVLLTEPACICIGIDTKSGLAGFILTRVAGDEAEILTVVVDSTARRFGCAGRLLRDSLSRLAAKSVSALFLEVDAENMPAVTLYRRNGFVEVGRRKAYYAKASGGRCDALVMRRDI